MEIQAYKSVFENHLTGYIQQNIEGQTPNHLYEPIKYILNLGGKRIRPLLALMCCELFGGKKEDALFAATCVELFHNFTLLHDDIMDAADVRRGKTTVHKKWSENIAILSGDAMMFLAAQQLEQYAPEKFKALSSIFNKTAVEVCEGQQMDMDFEERMDVTISEYLTMIGYKTAVLLGCALQMGAIIAEASSEDADHIYNFGLTLGLAFQLQDDYLDTFGDENFGKKIGGDISENKKTYLFLKALERCNDGDKQTLKKWYATNHYSVEKYNDVKAIFEKYQIDKLLLEQIEDYTQKALQIIDDMNVSANGSQLFKDFANSLMRRTT